MRAPRELFVELALDDVRRAADLLRPAYEANGRRDGFVAFAGTPDVADARTDPAAGGGVWDRLDAPTGLQALDRQLG